MSPRCIFRYIHVRNAKSRQIKFNRAAFGDKAERESSLHGIQDDRRPVPCSLPARIGIGDPFAQKSLNYAKFWPTCFPSVSRRSPPRTEPIKWPLPLVILWLCQISRVLVLRVSGRWMDRKGAISLGERKRDLSLFGIQVAKI